MEIFSNVKTFGEQWGYKCYLTPYNMMCHVTFTVTFISIISDFYTLPTCRQNLVQQSNNGNQNFNTHNKHLYISIQVTGNV